MPLFSPPRFQDCTVRKDNKIVREGLIVYDDGSEGATVDFNGLHLFPFKGMIICMIILEILAKFNQVL